MTTQTLPIPPETLKILRHYEAGLDPALSMHDRVRVLIRMCIDEGVHEGKLIVLAISLMDYNKQHVGIVLKEGAAIAGEALWQQADDGTYQITKIAKSE